MPNGWDQSAAAWIASQGEDGDFARRFILDRPMLQRIRNHSPGRIIDIGCGEGRFCRKLQEIGIQTVGLDCTGELIRCAQQRDKAGRYEIGSAESLNFSDSEFDGVICYLSLLDIDGIEQAVSELVRVVRPGGFILIANLNGFNTAGQWATNQNGESVFTIDHYMQPRAEWVEWDGIKIRNWHRPLSTYFNLMLSHGLKLQYFSEPLPYGGEPKTVERYARAPWFHIMDWEK